jgi:hypothetical protein
MKFLKVMKRNHSSMSELMDSFLELEEKQDAISKELGETKKKIFDMQRQAFEGKGDKEALGAGQIMLLDLESKFAAIGEMKSELREKMLIAARQEKEKKLLSLEEKVRKTRSEASAWNLEIIIAKAHMGVLRWIIDGIKIEPPAGVSQVEREMFKDRVDRLIRDFGIKKPLKAQREAAFQEIAVERQKIIDETYVEDLINASRPANPGVKN